MNCADFVHCQNNSEKYYSVELKFDIYCKTKVIEQTFYTIAKHGLLRHEDILKQSNAWLIYLTASGNM